MEFIQLAQGTVAVIDRCPWVLNARSEVVAKCGLQGLQGWQLDRVGDVERMNEIVFRGRYRGLAHGEAVRVECYLAVRNGLVRSRAEFVVRDPGFRNAGPGVDLLLALSMLQHAA